MGTLPHTTIIKDFLRWNRGKKYGPHLGLFFSIFGAIIAGIAIIDREEISD